MAEDLSNLQLPIELLYHVMSYVGDLSTLQNLSLTSKVWNNIANRKLWKHFKIHTQSFSTHVMECVCENGSLYQGNQRNRTITYKQAASYERINAPDIYQCDIFADDEQKLFDNSLWPYAVVDLHSTLDQGLSRPALASFIEHLTIDSNHMNLIENDEWCRVSHNLMQGLTAALVHSKSLVEITHSGILYPEVLMAMVNEKSTTLRALRVIRVIHGMLLLASNDCQEIERSGKFFPMDLKPIGELRALRTLRVIGLCMREGSGLGHAVTNLQCLETLHVSVTKDSGHTLDGVEDLHVSPINDFFFSVFGPRPPPIYPAPAYSADNEQRRSRLGNRYGFPDSLKSLTVIDNRFKYTLLTPTYVRTRFTPPRSLETINIQVRSFVQNLGNPTLFEVLTALMSSRTKHVLIKVHGLQCLTDRPEGELSYMLPFAATVEKWTFHLLPVYGRSILRRQLLPFLASPDCPPTARQLHLAPSPRSVPLRNTRNGHSMVSYLRLLDAGHGPYQFINGPPWTPSIRHLLLEDVDTRRLHLSSWIRKTLSLSHLRVLILVPSASSLLNPLSYPETQRLAVQIALNFHVSLRLFAIGDGEFWVGHHPQNLPAPSTSTSSPSRKLWSLYNASHDPEQILQMSGWAQQEDYDFWADARREGRFYGGVGMEMEETLQGERLVVYREEQ